MTTSNISHDVFVEIHFITRADKGVETNINFRLPGGGYLVMLAFDLHSEIFEQKGDLVADILLGVSGRDGKITFLRTNFVAGVGHFIATAVKDSFDRIDFIKRASGGGVILNIVEDEKFRFWTKEGGVANLRRLEIFLGTQCDAPRIPFVGLHRDRIDDRANETESGFGIKRIDHSGGGIRQDKHVGGVDRLPSADGGTIES